jgi:hypothetical protein
MQAAIAKELPKEDDSAIWKERLGNFQIRQSPHYTLLSDVQVQAVPDNWLKRMEDAYTGFVYWFALKGKTLKLPERRLLAILISEKDAFDVQHKQVFEDVPLVADGFYARRDNVAIYCSKPLDDQYDGLTNTTKGLWSTWDRKTLLKGGGWNKSGISNDMVARAQTLALLLQIIEEESELATITHEGVRQLLGAVALEGSDKPILPRTVEVPLWVQFGMAACFETPTGAFWPGMGAPNWTLLQKHKLLDNAKKLDKPEDALKNVVTDRYFSEAAREKEPKKALEKPQTLSWSLAYFLMQQRRDQLLRYFQELAQMPRDLEFDEETLLLTFARAFDLLDANKPNEVNPNKMYNLAKDWYQYIKLTPLEMTEVLNQAVKEQQSELKGSKRPPTK